ncbi:MAG: spermidine/putrescine transporter permease [Rhodospirillales bacterium]|jgi:spermidine/putrescine transport system permease protein|nr:spermidine/putrescine transporter permease [Rhodospirillales bacterium]
MTPTIRRAALMAPGLGWLALFLLVPCLLVLGLSFFERGVYGGIDYIFTFENYRRAVDPLYRSILLNSAWIAFLATLVSALIGYPAAYAIVKAPERWQSALLVLIMLPFWSNYLIRTYAWIVLLNREGLINRALAGLGATEPLPLLYNDFAIVLGLVYGYLPFMVLAIYASLSRLDPALLEQSADLGASPVSTFLRITLPLTLPGVAAGSVFVFVLSIGNFITPDLLGGGRRVMVGNLIYKQFLAARDWPFGSALAFLLIAIMMLLLLTQALLVRRSGGERPA